VLVLAACGGGGDSDPTPPPPPPPPPPANQAPTFGSLAFNTAEDQDLSARVTATDANNDTMTFSKTSDPTRGTLVSFGTDGAFTYRPNADFNGSDTFGVSVSDGRGGTTTGTASLTITSVNDAPRITALVVETNEDSSVSARVVATDPEGDAITFSKDSEPANGTVAAVATDGAFSYSPRRNFFGSDSFRVRATDAAGAAATASVAINVRAVNDDPPVATNDILRVTSAGMTTLAVVANDANPDGGALTVAIEGTPFIGVASVNQDNTVRLLAPPGFRGFTRFQYRITDSAGRSSVATTGVFVDVAPMRALFAAFEPGLPDRTVFFTNLVDPPSSMNAGITSTAPLRDFVGSLDGSAVLLSYGLTRRELVELVYRRTAPNSPVLRVPLDTIAGSKAVTMSPNGRWIAVTVTTESGTPLQYDQKLYLFDTDNPVVLRQLAPENSPFVAQPIFSADSSSLYVVAGPTRPTSATELPGGAAYRVALGTASTPITRVIEPLGGNLAIDIVSNFVQFSSDGLRTWFYATEIGVPQLGSLPVYYVDSSASNVARPITQGLPIAPQESLCGAIVDPTVTKVAYCVRGASPGDSNRIYVANLANPSAATLLTTAAAGQDLRVSNFRGDGQAVYLSAQIGSSFFDYDHYEQPISPTASRTYIGRGEFINGATNGDFVWLSVRPNTVNPDTFQRQLWGAYRGNFGAPVQLGTPGYYAAHRNFAGVNRGITILGEIPPPPAARPGTLGLVLVNASAPTALLPLTTLESPYPNGVLAQIMD
jgi:Bacterial Ig domain